MIGEAASYYYLWVALRALLPVALGAFLAGLVLAWVIWSLGGGRRGK